MKQINRIFFLIASVKMTLCDLMGNGPVSTRGNVPRNSPANRPLIVWLVLGGGWYSISSTHYGLVIRLGFFASDVPKLHHRVVSQRLLRKIRNTDIKLD